MTTRIITGDALTELAKMRAESVHMCVTSPPYFNLRDYQIAGQIGLEETPDQFVAVLVAVFREVRRVLRDDGVMFLNIGDSYAGSSTVNWRPGNPDKNRGNSNRDGVGSIPGIKPKDLVMIPARLAMALQEPFYTGRIKSVADRRWLAAMIDGEGCIYISRSKTGATTGRGRQYVRTQDAFDVGVSVSQKRPALLNECARIFGHGNVRKADEDHWDWRVFSSNARQLLKEVYPYLIAKQQEARLALGCPPSGDKATDAWGALKEIHKGGAAAVDFPEQPSLYEPGWYLRQDIIWSKKNPMPESVTDRCTKAHENLFLLSKSERYYFDAAAIAEPAEFGPSIPRDGAARGPFAGNQLGGMGGFRGGSRAPGEGGTRNKRSVWTIATAPFPGAHFAVFPPALVEPCILAGCPKGGTVLDPFGGAGTTGLVADRLGRNAIMIELNPTYAEMARSRIADDAGMFFEAAE